MLQAGFYLLQEGLAMIEFNHTVKDPNGIHARPAGLLAKEASRFASEITVRKDNRSANMKGLFSLMSLTVKSGDVITVSVNGQDEKEAAADLKTYMESNL